MSKKATIEQRLTILEEAVINIQNQIKSNPKSDNWLDNVIGSISDEETFLEALEYGQKFRQETISMNDIQDQK
ncbi:transferase hexapeptide repeat containing protein [Cyanobacterium aponinum UTEX 3222]|uniref:transferase hexapeptide repeat containing protein n=1 Tax=Cyanobacterium TaxID=102234 RepID=UPI002E80CDEC|nr:transferase hexapeptide repeat containing protein [Cyanobacterium sp. Dongsha4]WRL42012.1 transferase hexapeptide repeat containing protein [Cyanobacterium aponinum UTEX 3222]WVL01268.1 transferase hexapeptide repeat containing protein [Cyanobacterium sp. Dongsha4]